MRAKQCGTRLCDIAENSLFLRRKAFHRLHEIRDQIRTPLQDHIHLRPRRVDTFAFHDHLVSAAYKRAPEHQSDDQQYCQNDQSYFHFCLESLEFMNLHFSRAAIPAWEDDGPAPSKVSPSLLDTHQRPG